MTENLTKKLKKKKGFTLIELIIVVAIIAILAALAIPKLMGTQDNAKKNGDIANAKLIHDTAAKLMTEDNITIGNATGTLELTVGSATSSTTNETNLNNALQTHPKAKYKTHNGQEFKVEIDTASKDIKVYAGSNSDSNLVYPQPASGDYAK